MDTIFSQALDSDAGAQNGYTIVMNFAVAALTLPSKGIARIRATFEGGSVEGLTITNAYVGHAAAAGDAYDFSATPVQLLFAGSASKVIGAGQTAISDWADFPYDKTSALLIAFYQGGGVGSDTARYKAAVANVTQYYKLANDAATVNKTGYSSVAQLDVINKIEVETVGGGFFVFF